VAAVAMAGAAVRLLMLNVPMRCAKSSAHVNVD